MQLLRRSVGAATRGLLVVSVALVLFACSGDTAKRSIITANHLQDSLANAYNEAKSLEAAAGKDCKAKADVAHVTLPAPTDPAALKACAALGVEIPFDPVKLQALAKPLNEAYSGVRAADAIRKAVDARTATPEQLSAALIDVVTKLAALYREAAGLGLQVDTTKANALLAQVTK